ncbi:MAG: replication protein [Chloroflexota bacterium]|nr:replication protein [Chloroflexota bacterium]
MPDVPVHPATPYPDWAGFDAPRYTPVPDDVFDLWLPHLSGAELKVLLYICRRTFGFKKEADSISFAQLTHGITTQAGRALDHGTGLSMAGAQTAVKGLLTQGLIVKQTNKAADGGNAPTTYRLRLRGDTPHPGLIPSAKNQYGGMLEIGIPLYQKLATQETDVQETESQEDSNPPAPQKTRRNGHTPAATPAAAPVSLRDSAPRYTGPHSPYLAGVIFDHSTELGDAAHKAANSTQAHRLWQASGLDEAAFVALLHTARQRVRTYQGKQGTGTITNKMGYYFRVLAALVAGTDSAPVDHP